MNGKAFIPLLSAYACAVPAIMATRTIENKRDRLATILVTPFMTCSARLPVYMLLIAAFIPNTHLPARLSRPADAGHAGPLPGRLCGRHDHRMAAQELHPQVQRDALHPGAAAVPHAHAALAGSCASSIARSVFLRQAGTVILCVTLALWVLAHLPVIRYASGSISAPELADSLIGRLGHFIEPAIAPLGFNWKIGIGLHLQRGWPARSWSAPWARSTAPTPTPQTLNLHTALHHDMTLGGALALMIFFAFAMQCTSTMAVVRRETNSWKWPAIQFSYMLVLAWVAAFVVNQSPWYFLR